MGRFSAGKAPKTPTERRAALATIDFQSDWQPWIAPIERAYYRLNEADLTQRVRDYVASHAHELFIEEE